MNDEIKQTYLKMRGAEPDVVGISQENRRKICVEDVNTNQDIDVSIVKLKNLGYTFEQISKIVDKSRSNVFERYNKIIKKTKNNE